MKNEEQLMDFIA